MEGLGLLPVVTRFEGDKATYRVQARVTAQNGFLAEITGETIEGYEIHMGRTETDKPLAEITKREGQRVSLLDGCVSADGRVFGSYLHGLFDNDHFRRAWLKSLGSQVGEKSFRDARESAFENLADAVEEAMDMDRVDKILGF
jgi:adenosylcobyric acid synthase